MIDEKMTIAETGQLGGAAASMRNSRTLNTLVGVRVRWYEVKNAGARLQR
jgi:hypothetical protein